MALNGSTAKAEEQARHAEDEARAYRAFIERGFLAALRYQPEWASVYGHLLDIGIWTSQLRMAIYEATIDHTDDEGRVDVSALLTQLVEQAEPRPDGNYLPPIDLTRELELIDDARCISPGRLTLWLRELPSIQERFRDEAVEAVNIGGTPDEILERLQALRDMCSAREDTRDQQLMDGFVDPAEREGTTHSGPACDGSIRRSVRGHRHAAR